MLMAMQSGNAAPSERIHGGAGEGLQQQQQQLGRGQQWWPNHQSFVQVDDRDGFILWLKGEFAAANAIIDALCHHMTMVVGEPGEYDGVVQSLQQRRHNWSSVLHMQQYFSVHEVVYALQQVAIRRNPPPPQQRGYDGSGKVGKEYRRGGGGRGGQRWDGFRDGKDGYHGQNFGNFDGGLVYGKEMNGNENVEDGEGRVTNGKVEEKEESVEVDGSVESTGSGKAAFTGSCDVATDKQNVTAIPKTFVATEMHDGKTVNVVEGLKLFEELLDCSEVSKFVTLVNDMRVAGKRGQLQGETFLVFKRPMKGHGREMVQFGLPVADAPFEDEVAAGTSKDWKIESIPSLFEEVIERLVAMQVVTVKPDCCIVDIFNEGDHSHPHMWPYWFGRPVCVLSLTDCEMTFGKVIAIARPGDYRGSLQISLTPGSMLVLEGRSSDLAKHAISSTSKQRILVTFAKSLPKRITANDQRFPSTATPLPSHWVPPPSRSLNHIRHPVGPKLYGPVPASGVLPAPSTHPPLATPNGIQPIFVPAAVAPAIPFPTPVALPPASAGWPAAPPRHPPPPRLPVPGTGVFLPPGSGNLANQSVVFNPASENINVEISSVREKDDGQVNLSFRNTSPKGASDEKVQQQECNGGKGSIANEEQHRNLEVHAAGKPMGLVSS